MEKLLRWPKNWLFGVHKLRALCQCLSVLSSTRCLLSPSGIISSLAIRQVCGLPAKNIRRHVNLIEALPELNEVLLRFCEMSHAVDDSRE